MSKFYWPATGLFSAVLAFNLLGATAPPRCVGGSISRESRKH